MSSAPIRIIIDAISSYPRRRRDVCVLKAYFDDSGTHLDSDVVVMGGVIAPLEDWESYEPLWQAQLDYFGITKMHMSHCERAQQQFSGWDRDRRDLCIDKFSDIVCSIGGRMLVSAVSRQDWNMACEKTNLGEWFSDPIDFLFNTCMRRALESRRVDRPQGEEVMVTFDCREQNINFWTNLAKGYEKRWSDKLAGFAFGQMAKVLPLQAADMIAYEAFRLQCDYLRTGSDIATRPALIKMIGGMASYAGFYSEKSLVAYAQDLERDR